MEEYFLLHKWTCSTTNGVTQNKSDSYCIDGNDGHETCAGAALFSASASLFASDSVTDYVPPTLLSLRQGLTL